MSTPNTHYGYRAIAGVMKNAKSVFFIGIGGVSMSSLAEMTALRGIKTGGSDRTQTAVTERLAANGAEIFYGHDSHHISGYDVVVYTVAISPDNPEYAAAVNSGIPCFSRADYMGWLMTGYGTRIGVSGMHGKSTTTSMCATAFMAAGADPSVICGASVPAMGASYRAAADKYFIFEACEYLDSFLDFNPTVAIVLNIELEHLDYFESIFQIRRSFANFVARAGSSGTAIINADDENVLLAMATCPGRKITFSGSGDTRADFYAANTDMSRGLPSFDIFTQNGFAAHIDLDIPGRHNIYNALAAFAAASLCGLDPEAVAQGLSSFSGAERRMEYKGKLGDADVYDDYGHHPTEIAATLRGCRDMGYDRVFCVFQPHTYSRTAALFDDFVNALRLADGVFLADIYAARERETLGMSSAKLADEIGRSAIYCPTLEDIAEKLRGVAHDRDAIIVMGAGDITKLFPLIGF